VLTVSSARKVEQGWDPTVKRLYDGSRAYYDITVPVNINNEITERIYGTSQRLSDYSADALRGREAEFLRRISWTLREGRRGQAS
jgi:hypothetical protein